MARRPRVDMAGFHHIVNRGVAKYKVYRCSEDKEKFLEIKEAIRAIPYIKILH
jgi:hypothetical protein